MHKEKSSSNYARFVLNKQLKWRMMLKSKKNTLIKKLFVHVKNQDMTCRAL